MFKFRSFLCLTAAACLGLAVTACSPQEEAEEAPVTEITIEDEDMEVEEVEVEAGEEMPATAPVIIEEAAPVEAIEIPATAPAATAPAF